ncbi:hypothetical protein INT44_005229 [Umbelopsis vinacea]|uniref:UDENN domain-containing protein n=1 Tax=Umbelopsis vinacea TaxID=44442 RepID=A0A8H7Q8J9_9FUNG|nr:hypothetical protein INT44_005229 [Umbelopsis vinacea]
MDIASTTPKIKSPLRANHSAADLFVSTSSPSLRPQLTRSQSTHSRHSSASSVNSAVHPHSPNPSSLRHTIPTPIYHHDQEADIGEGFSTSDSHSHYNHLLTGLCHSEPLLAPALDSQHSQSGSCTTTSLSDEEEVSSRTSSSDVLGAGAMFEMDTDITELRDSNKLSNLSPDVLAKFRQWMVGFCVVNFDLEIGQALDFIYPPVELSEYEEKNICFSAFPDSNVFEVGDQVYNVRIRASGSGLTASGPTADAGFLYGYVFFRQKKDDRIRRGYFQKSLVLLSQHPFVGLFSRVVSMLGPAFFDLGQPMLEAACASIASWNGPLPGQSYDLPLLGTVLQVEIPYPHKPQLLETSRFDLNSLKPETQILASIPPGTLYKHFSNMLDDLWLLWELVLLGEPLIVMAPEPGICSESVVALVDLINPIPYCGDYRPYFTIQDSDFRSFITKSMPPSNLILGVTNPFFNKAIGHWPHIVRVGRHQHRKPDGTIIPEHGRHGKGSHSRPNGALDFVQGVTSKRKATISKDKALLKMLVESRVRGHSSAYVLNNILRRHFADMTEKFLTPLNRYFHQLLPTNVSSSTLKKGQGQLKPFQSDQFYRFLKDNPPSLQFKSTFKARATTGDPVREFYTQFLKCGNFATWLRLRTNEAQNEIKHRYIRKLCDADVTRKITSSREVEAVDLLVRYQDALHLVQDEDAHNTLDMEKLQKQIDIIIRTLPADLRNSLEH